MNAVVITASPRLPSTVQGSGIDYNTYDTVSDRGMPSKFYGRFETDVIGDFELLFESGGPYRTIEKFEPIGRSWKRK